MLRFIGVYDYTVILTYMSVFSAVVGMIFTADGRFTAAVLCLMFSGLCDAFDGAVARSKKNRTEDEKAFGIQLDSLCDVVSFGVFPAYLCYHMGVDGIVGMICVFAYVLCAVSRLAFFNVQEGKRQQAEGGKNKVYRGLPVTSISFILPMAFWLQFLMSDYVFLVLLHGLLILVGTLFILDFPLKKPGLKAILAAIAAVIVTVFIIQAYTKFKLPANNDESSQIIGEIVETDVTKTP
mgnify:CR=1 FL=1